MCFPELFDTKITNAALVNALQKVDKKNKEKNPKKNVKFQSGKNVHKKESTSANLSSGAKTRLACYRCGNTGHFGKDPSCPAKNSNCRKCNLKGHWDKMSNKHL